MKNSLPEALIRILWDVDLNKFDPTQYQEFLAVRVAEKGNVPAVKWYIQHFGLEKLLNYVNNSPEVRLATKAFWNYYAAN